MKLYKKYFFLPILYGIIFSWHWYFNAEGRITFGKVIFEFDGGYWGNPGGFSGTFSSYIEVFVPFIMYTIVFSTYIYRHFCNSSVYVFSRCESRSKWFAKESVKLFGYTILNTSCILFGYAIIGMIQKKFVLLNDIKVIIWYITMYSLWAFQLVLMANIISFMKGNIAGLTSALSVQFLFVLAIAVIDPQKVVGINKLKVKYNPLSYLVANWYKDKDLGYFNKEGMLTMSDGYMILGIMCILVLIIGMIVIEKIDIIENKEM